jgi:hypothetical protein
MAKFCKTQRKNGKKVKTKRENEDNPKKSAEKWRSFVKLSGRMAKRRNIERAIF